MRAGGGRVFGNRAGQPHQSQVRRHRGRREGTHRPHGGNGAGKRGQRGRNHGSHPTGEARPGHEHRPALSGPAHHGRLPRSRGQLPGYGQLRAARRGQVRIQVAMGLPEKISGQGPYGPVGQRLRPRRDQRVLRLRPETSAGRNPCAGHHRRQRRGSRPALRHQLQSRNQPARSFCPRQLLGERPGDATGNAANGWKPILCPGK